MFKRYSMIQLKEAMDLLRAETRKPVSTTEVIESSFTKPQLVEWSDFLTVNAHPYFHGKRSPGAAADWTIAAWKRLREVVPNDKPILLKRWVFPWQASLN